MIHFDLPWSLITVEQRNGRIDRYGQLKSPEIRYLIYNPADPEVASDVRVVAKLVEKENIAHKALGDAASVMGLYSETVEEQAIIEALRQRTQDEKEAVLEEKAPTEAAFDPWAFVGIDSGRDDTTSPTVTVDPPSTLFDESGDYLTAGLRLVYDDLKALSWEVDGEVLSFQPPEDLMRRLASLPQSYLRQRDLRPTAPHHRPLRRQRIAPARYQRQGNRRRDRHRLARDPLPRTTTSGARMDRRQDPLPDRPERSRRHPLQRR
jgi:hypothetical protein